MSAENETYQEGQRLLKELTALRNDVLNINASDTQCKEQALRLIERSRAELREALTVLAGLV
jgi:hypothetical protein